MTTWIGIAILVVCFAIRYGGSLWPFISGAFSSVGNAAGAVRGYFARSTTQQNVPLKQDAIPTAAQAFAALQVAVTFKVKGKADPAYALVMAALAKLQEGA